MNEIYGALKYNTRTWKKEFFAVAGVLYSLLSVALSFGSWEEWGIMTSAPKVFIFAFGIVLAIIISAVYILVKRTRTIWTCGTGSIVLTYGDIVKLCFPVKKKPCNVVIPVNTAFDTIVDYDTSVDKMLVSRTSIHGKWLEAYTTHSGKNINDLDGELENKLKSVSPIKELSQGNNPRGKQKVYKQGTIVPIKCKNGVTAFLVALSDFDDNNNAQSDKMIIIECVEKIIDYNNKHGNGETLYIPLLGTGLSRAGLNHEDSLQLIRNVLELNCENIHGNVQVVIWDGDRDKVSIFPKI